jgi:hypothetical protein
MCDMRGLLSVLLFIAAATGQIVIQPKKQVPLKTVEGTLRLRDAKRLIIDADDKRTLLIQIDKQTDFGRNALEKLRPGDHLRIDAREGEERYMFAVTVELVRAGTDAERAKASQPLPPDSLDVQVEMDAKSKRPSMSGPGSSPLPVAPEKQTPAQQAAQKKEEEDAIAEPREAYTVVKSQSGADPDRPKLSRGKPRKSASAEEPVDPVSVTAVAGEPLLVASAAAAPVVREPVAASGPREDPVLAKAREAIGSLSADLPNYTVRQMTTRKYSDTSRVEWKVQDVVEAELIVEGDREHYRNVRINGKSAKTRPEDTGAWSVGEFVTTPTQLLGSGAAEFKNRIETNINGRKAWRYDYNVPQEASGWRIEIAGQSFHPAQRGRLWLDKETARVIRLEMEGRQFPAEFPIDKAETTLEYDFVSIGTRKFLLPVKSEVLSCHRGKPDCSLNVLEFRNYRKFEAESQLIAEPVK